MVFTQAMLDALDAARAQGAREITFKDQRFVFDSVEDYIKLRSIIKNELAQASAQPIRQVQIYTDNGWGY